MSYDFATVTKKVCSSCCSSKPVSDFYRRSGTPDGRAYSCKACARGFQVKFRSTGKNLTYGRNRKLANQAFLNSVKSSSPCADCGELYEPECMEFDHLHSKRANLSQALSWSRESLLEELAKCEVVCVLCHRDRTHSRSGSPITENKWAKLNRAFVSQQKSGPCARCSLQFSPWQMDFDHLPGMEKKSKVSDLAALQRHSLKRIREEISKCQLLCALCHRRKSVSESRDEGRHYVV